MMGLGGLHQKTIKFKMSRVTVIRFQTPKKNMTCIQHSIASNKILHGHADMQK